ncbi:alpha 1,2 mannosyltransferase [Coemansia spiralis]|uniref:Mannosyltransferase n=2 Tax=Coemansia TaxID=4863 RepID=A0A9W8KVD0_9FUNG|nr:alpha 1,2 mannosyltransferase [Coemansia umbellata]KAJ2620366.1 alpha 1,2 mannosyltransferase [Coemansia sp. RSA 1358]KAJ2670373.1 alpha 1,2 mannosyltransferase [Coemansia spiralis]
MQLQSRVLYAVLMASRVLVALSPAYIHPDEFFQSPEVAANDILGVQALRTWEFASKSPIRSIVPIYLYSGVPFAGLKLTLSVLQTLGFQIELTTRLIFCSQRVFMALLSFVVDISIYTAIRRLSPDARLRPTMLLLATCHCLAVFHTHPFGNSFASIILALCFALLSQIEHGFNVMAKYNKTSGKIRSTTLSLIRPVCALAVCLVLGVFSHITFAAFALPVAFACVVMVVQSTLHGELPILRAVAIVFAAGLSATLAAAAIILVDSVYYNSFNLSTVGSLPAIAGSLTCTVLNNFRYNSDNSNLVTHGMHPWYMHLVASMPTLFGPLYVLSVLKLWSFTRSLFKRNTGHTHCLSIAASSSAILGIGVLSTVAHQEPRFLVLALPGIVISTWRWHRLAPQYFWHLWISYNIVLTLIFAGVHQAGAVPVLEYVSKTSVASKMDCHLHAGDLVCARSLQLANAGSPKLKTKVLLYATYMAPRHLLAQPQDDSMQAYVELIDLVSASDYEVYAAIDSAVSVNCTHINRQDGSDQLVFGLSEDSQSYERTLFVAPASADLGLIMPTESSRFTLMPVYSYGPHVNFDHIQRVLQQPLKRSRLNVYLICKA